jgi:hypothetical protein
MHPKTLRRTPRRPSVGVSGANQDASPASHPLPLLPWLGKVQEVSAAVALLLPGALTYGRASGSDTWGWGCGSAWSRRVALADTWTYCKGKIGEGWGGGGGGDSSLAELACQVWFGFGGKFGYLFSLSFICFVRGFSDHFILDWPFAFFNEVRPNLFLVYMQKLWKYNLKRQKREMYFGCTSIDFMFTHKNFPGKGVLCENFKKCPEKLFWSTENYHENCLFSRKTLWANIEYLNVCWIFLDFKKIWFLGRDAPISLISGFPCPSTFSSVVCLFVFSCGRTVRGERNSSTTFSLLCRQAVRTWWSGWKYSGIEEATTRVVTVAIEERTNRRA